MPSRLLHAIYAPAATVLLCLLLPLVCLAVIAGPSVALRREIARIGVRFMLACVGVPLRVRGAAHLPQQPAIVVSNHASYLDGLVMTAALPRRYTFIVQDGAASWPLVGLTLRRMGVEFVDRGNARSAAALTRSLIRRLGAGESFVIFPEGTFKADPGLLPFKKGAFVIATRAGVPVVPAAIRGTRRLYGGKRRLPRWSPVEVQILKPLLPGTAEEAASLLRQQAREQVLAICGEPDRHPHHEG